ncbi:MAG TPA: hypothetical protein VI479_20275 [Blastocatellia bacterium]
MSLEEAKQKHMETGAALTKVAVEKKSLPGQIEAAASAGDSKKLATLSARKVAIEAEFVAANIADKQAQIEVFEAEVAEASARALELTNALPAETDRLKKEREDLQARLEQNGNDSHRLHCEEIRARQIVDDLKAKVAGARGALDHHIQSSKQAALRAA